MSITILTADGAELEADMPALRQIKMIKALLDDLGWDEKEKEVIPVPTVHSYTMKKVLEWVKHHENDPPFTDEKRKDETVSEWDKEFLKKLDVGSLFEIVIASNTLEVEGLLHAACLTVTGMIKGKTPEEIRKNFNVRGDFSEEEEEQIMRENKWLEEK